jgi:creatinine amidohydrolase
MSSPTPGPELERLTWTEVRDAIARDAGVIVPVGATEQHGHHLPLSTDVVLARSLALAVAAGTDVLVAPAIPYGYRSRPLSGGGQGFPGTISLSANTFIAVLSEVLGELMRHGFRRLAILNWHHENENFVYEAAWLAHERTGRSGARILVFENPGGEPSQSVMRTLFADGFPGWDAEHAAIVETSLMLHLAPDLVRMDRAVDDESPRRPGYDIVPPPEDLVAPSGTLWKATQATAAKGELVWAEIVRTVTGEMASEFATKDPSAVWPT